MPASAVIPDANYSPIVDCTSDHTAETVLVGDLSDVGADSASTASDAAKRVRQVGCEQAVNDYVGTADWAATRVRWIAFVPTPEQWDAGDRWYRCDLDLQLLGGSSHVSDTIRLSLHNGWTPELFDLYHLCINDHGAAPGSAINTSCGGRHTIEPLGVVDLPGDFDTPYPGEDAIADQTGQLCDAAVAQFIGGSPDRIKTVYYPPAEDAWPSTHNVVCGVESLDGYLVGSLRDHGSGQIAVVPFE